MRYYRQDIQLLHEEVQFRLEIQNPRKRRDLSFIGILGIYTLQLIDANVEAHLFLFDSSDNLSLDISFSSTFIYNKRITPLLSMNYQIGKEKTTKRRFYN